MLQPPRRNFSRVVCAWLFCLVGVLLPFVAFAKSSSARRDYLIDVWTTEKGLPDSSVTSIAQTPDGYLWVGTYKGLARFDGARFVTFDPENTPELQHARIRKLFLDEQGTLWINTYDGSLTSWHNGAFKLEWSSKASADYDVARAGSKADHVTFVLPTGEMIRRDFGGANADWRVIQPPTNGLGTLACEDAEGTLWCRGRDSQLWRLAGERFELVTTNLGLVAGARVRTVNTDGHGRVWAATDRAVMAWAGGRFKNMTPTNGAPEVDVNFLFQTRDGGVWAVANEKLRKFTGQRWGEGVEPWEESLTGAMVMRLGAHEQADGTVWFYQYGLGLVCVMTDGATHRFTAEEGFPGDRVDCFFEDSEGNLWAGVNRGGLVRLRKQRFQVVTVGEGAQPVVMQTVCEDAGGVMWLGTAGNGLARWQDEKLSDFTLPGGSGKGSAKGFVFSAYPGTQDELWLSIGDEDLYVLANRRIERCSPYIHGVKTILASRDGRTVWAGTKIGLFVCTNRATRSFAPYPGFPRSVDVRALAESADGTLWAGGGDGNLYRVATNGIEMLAPKTRYPIWSLLLDKDGTVWAGTFRGGLLCYRPDGFRRFSVANGLPDSVISQLLSDDDGNLWIGSHQGIFRVARTELDAYAKGKRTTIASTVYGRLDGLPSLECSGSYQPACWRARDGRLWFTTAAGVVAIQPGDATPNVLPPPVAIEEVLIDVKQQDLKSLGRQPSLVDLGRGRQRELLPVLEVPPGKRQFEFRFTALSFVSPDKVRFRYKLVGLEKDWVEAGPRRSAQYSYAQYSFLRPGEYQFQVTACNNEGVWNRVGSGLILHVRPHFYETKTFFLLAILCGAGMILLFARAVYRRRLRAAMERVERQRAVERDRARIAKDIHDDLGAGLTQITLLSELAKNDSPEEVVGHVGQISGTARELTRAMDEIVWAINPQNDTLEGLITYVSKFAQQYLTVAGMRCRLDVPVELPAYTLGAEVRHNLYLAIKEALNNVVKHSGATVASLRLEYAAGKVTLTIEDDGCGLEQSPGKRVAASGRTSSGHGLVNMKRRLEDIGGRCELSAMPGGGTKVQFTIQVLPGGSPVLATAATHEEG